MSMDPFASHLPVLQAVVKMTKRGILELGMGMYSTRYLMTEDRTITSVEDNESVFDNVRNTPQPPSKKHKFVLLDANQPKRWETFYAAFNAVDYDVVFADNSPWEARLEAVNYFKDKVAVVLLHDCDYYVKNRLLGKVHGDDQFDFSDVFKYYVVYVPLHGGPPTLVGSNVIDVTKELTFSTSTSAPRKQVPRDPLVELYE